MSAGCVEAVREYSVAVSLSRDRLLHFSANCSNLCLFFLLFLGGRVVDLHETSLHAGESYLKRDKYGTSSPPNRDLKTFTV